MIQLEADFLFLVLVRQGAIPPDSMKQRAVLVQPGTIPPVPMSQGRVLVLWYLVVQELTSEWRAPIQLAAVATVEIPFVVLPGLVCHDQRINSSQGGGGAKVMVYIIKGN